MSCITLQNEKYWICPYHEFTSAALYFSMATECHFFLCASSSPLSLLFRNIIGDKGSIPSPIEDERGAVVPSPTKEERGAFLHPL
jgi:hypothetical protein